MLAYTTPQFDVLIHYKRKINQNIQSLANDASLHDYIRLLTETLWPNNEAFMQFAGRSPKEKLQLFHTARGTFIDYILGKAFIFDQQGSCMTHQKHKGVGTPVLGRGNCKRGARRFFDMVQVSALNQLLLVNLSEAMLRGIQTEMMMLMASAWH